MMEIEIEKMLGRLGVETFDETSLHKALKRVPDLSINGPWIAGGAVRRTIQCTNLDSDFDFFFRDEIQKNKYAEDLIKMGALHLSNNDKNTLFILPSSVHEEGDVKTYLPEMKIQLIHFQYYESAHDVIDSFDFTLCMFAFDGTKMYIGDFSLWDLSRKKIVPNKITYATSSLRRLIKYTNQGFTACGGCLSEMLEQVAKNPSIINSDTLYID